MTITRFARREKLAIYTPISAIMNFQKASLPDKRELGRLLCRREHGTEIGPMA
jgi:hypothetical protein